MKRIPAPKMKRIEGVSERSNGRIIREELPPYWLLSELLFHITTLCLDAYERIFPRLLLDSVSSIHDFKPREDAFFYKTYTAAYNRNQNLYVEWEGKIPAEELAAWEAEAYLKKRNEDVPQYQIFIDAGNFITQEYRFLSKDLRAVTDLAFSGFILTALNSPDFASLCKNKDVDAAAMTFEQKLDVELDHEALHNRLMVQLGHA